MHAREQKCIVCWEYGSKPIIRLYCCVPLVMIVMILIIGIKGGYKFMLGC